MVHESWAPASERELVIHREAWCPGEGFHWEHRTYTLVCGKSPPSAGLQLGLCSLGTVSFLSFRSVAELPAPSYSPAIRVDV